MYIVKWKSVKKDIIVVRQLKSVIENTRRFSKRDAKEEPENVRINTASKPANLHFLDQ
jgi:hypothetical protein